MCLQFVGGLAAQQAPTKRPLTHEDYDRWPSVRDTQYSHDGRWMCFVIAPAVGDSVLHVREVDGDRSYTFDNGRGASFSNDNKKLLFKVAKSPTEERRKKIEKLHEKKEEKEKEGESGEEEGSLPPDIKAALKERGMPEARARRMMEQRGSSLAEMRGFLGLPEPEEKSESKSGESKSKKDDEDKEAKALTQRLHILDLASGEIVEVERVKSHSQPKKSDLLVIHFEKPEAKKKDGKKDDKKKAGSEESEGGESSEKTEEVAKGEAGKEPAKGAEEAGEEASKVAKKDKDPKEKKRKDGTELRIRNLASTADDDVVIEHVRSYGMAGDDRWLWYAVGTKKMVDGVEHGLFARELGTGRTVALLPGYSNCSGFRSDKEDQHLVFSSDLDEFGEDDAQKAIYHWSFTDAPARLIVNADTDGMLEDYRIQSSGLGFSRDGSIVTFGIKPPKREDLPKILAEDTVKMDLWHWRDGLLQTMQAKRGNPDEATLTAIYDPDEDRVVVLGDRDAPRASLVTHDGSIALVSNSKPYEQQVTWDGRYNDYYLVNTANGAREKIITGLRGSASASPGGRYVIWFDHRDYDWHTRDVKTGQVRNLTEAIGVAFDRELDDRPEPHRAHGRAGWTENDGEVLLYDEFDVWAINPATGESRCVTEGSGRANSIRFRVAGPDLRPDATRDDDEDKDFLEGAVSLSATNLDTYEQGYYSDSIEGMAPPRKLIMQDRAIGSVSRPRDADRLFMTFSRFDEYPDIWTTDLAFEEPRKLTDACPLLADLSWGKAELVEWQSDDGVDLKGYLIKPDGFDATRQYPMMVYFYERSSQGIHRFVRPSAGTSPNAAYYVSNGYLWFVPDIVYSDGYPGESCEKCVVSGVQHVVSMGFVDRDAIGAAGHSWGGYQTAHLITRTDIFAAVESGAPVVNMFSAYGGIRWGSGMSRQFQYEKTQSRIGGTIWEYPMRYWENSPLFHLDKVETPVIILHNDEDGAVPWYQGIEFFVAMRRLGKEAYLMNYNGEAHGLRKKQNQRDWTRRMQQFFDHHLKGAEAPAWMQSGVPYHERMAEKIPNAKSYQEAVEAGLIESAEAAEESGSGVPTEASTGESNNRR